MPRKTSIDTYREIEANGLLSEKRFEIYQILYELGPLTATQVASKMRGMKSQSVGANVHARLCELRDLQTVMECGEALCPITHRNVILWDVTDQLPKKIEKEEVKSIFVFFPKMHDERPEYFSTKQKANERASESTGMVYEVFKG